MTTDWTTTDSEAAIDRQLDAAVESAGGARLPLARAVVDESEDRWFGQVLARTYRAVADDADHELVGRAGAAVELLRAYCRLRNELLVQIDGSVPHSLDRDRTVALLAGDFLYAAAYSTLGEIDRPTLDACYRTLAETSSDLVRTFHTIRDRAGASADDHVSLVDGTAGRLGESAAVVGVTLAGADESHRDHFASLGRGLSTARQIRLAIEDEGSPDGIVPPAVDEERLRYHATRQFAMATDARNRLRSVAETERLRPLFEAAEFDA
ncbi:polyprenyl synthetase family protein [Halosimplex sp. J119]